jgi:hypothetical protein
MIEAVYRACGALPPPIKEPSLLHSGNPELYLPVSHIMKVRRYLRFRSDSHDYVRAISQKRREDMAYRYDRSVRPAYHQLQDLVMLHQKTSGKLQSR